MTVWLLENTADPGQVFDEEAKDDQVHGRLGDHVEVGQVVLNHLFEPIEVVDLFIQPVVLLAAPEIAEEQVAKVVVRDEDIGREKAFLFG